MKIEIGDLAQDKITGFKGIVIGKTSWLTGCDTCGLKPENLDKDGKVPDAVWFDEVQLKVIKKSKTNFEKDIKTSKAGGPKPIPQMGRR